MIHDYFNTFPKDEWQSACTRFPSTKFARFGSLKGRAICMAQMPYHALAIVIKPIAYVALGIIFTICSHGFEEEKKRAWVRMKGINFILTGLVAPFSQVVQLSKAALGVIYPGFYFKPNDFEPYFTALVKLAQEKGCKQNLINLFEKSPSFLEKALLGGGASAHYHALFKRDLEIICKKLQEPGRSDDETRAILEMFDSLEDESFKSGIQACSPGVGRLLDQIADCLDTPSEAEKILPHLTTNFKVEILHQMIMQFTASNEKYILDCEGYSEENKEFSRSNNVHISNKLIFSIGKAIDLPSHIIENASYDYIVDPYNQQEQKELHDRFNQLYTDEKLINYLVDRVNSQPDGRPGLKKFRDAVIQKLCETTSEEAIKGDSQMIQETFKIGPEIAEDPIYYVKLHYFLYPDADPSDEKASDLNAQGIRAYRDACLK